MTKTTTNPAAIATAQSKALAAPVFKGAGKAARTNAFGMIATRAFGEALTRDAMIAEIRTALGKAPSEGELRAARNEFVIGRVAARLTVADMPKGCDTAEKQIAHARKLVLLCAAPAQDGKTSYKLKFWQAGRRTISQHKLIRAAEEAWSGVKAELGFGQAQTQSQRTAAKKNGARMAGDVSKGKGNAPTHAELVKPIKADDACQHIASQASALLAYANKYAKLLPASYGTAVHAFKAAITAAENERVNG